MPNMIPWNGDCNTPSPAMPRRGRRHTIHAASTATPSTEDLYGYERGLTHDHPPLPPVEHMSPERRARKQRIRTSRRGGALHADLLKSAVLATLEAEEEVNTPNSSGGAIPQRRHSMMNIETTAILQSMGSMDDSQHRNPRKRARQQRMDCSGGTGNDSTNGDAELLEDCLLNFCTISNTTTTRQPNQQPHNQQPITMTESEQQQKPTRTATISTEPPVRFVARRTSKELASGIVPSPRTNGETK